VRARSSDVRKPVKIAVTSNGRHVCGTFASISCSSRLVGILIALEHQRLIADIRGQLVEIPCAAIVIDTPNRSLGSSESSDKDMIAYVKGADAIREAFQCAVIVIHHCGLDDKRPRGHTSLTGAADAQIAVRRDDSDVIVATVEYMKDGEAGAEFRRGWRSSTSMTMRTERPSPHA
jgi:hypothetical protein